MTQFERPSGAYAGAAGLGNRTKYQDDAVAVPKQPISSSKMDGEFNYVIDALNTVNVAKGSRGSIGERLDVNLNADGTFKASVVAGLDDWIVHSAPTALTRVSDTTVTLAGGDYRSLYPVNRRIKLMIAGAPFYGDVANCTFAAGVTTLGLVGLVDAAGAAAVIASNPASMAYGPLLSGATGNAPVRSQKLVVAEYVLEAAGPDLKVAPVTGGAGVTIGAGGLSGVADGAVALAALAAGVVERLVPAGTVLPFGGASAPSGYLLCAGQAVSRTTYTALFTAIGTVYGAGDGSSTFNVPDLRGRSVFGKDDMNGTAANRVTNAVSGVTASTLGAAGGNQAMQQHTHTVTDPGHVHHTIVPNTTYAPAQAGAGGASILAGVGTNVGSSLVNTNNTMTSATTGITLAQTGAGSSQNMPPVLILNYIIKA